MIEGTNLQGELNKRHEFQKIMKNFSSSDSSSPKSTKLANIGSEMHSFKGTAISNT